MKSVLSPLALQALKKARLAGRHTPVPRPKTNSRTADKFLIRGYEELFNEVAGMASHEGEVSTPRSWRRYSMLCKGM